MFSAEIFLILIGWAVAGGSPGPATLAVSGAAMGGGRAAGLAMAAGVVAGSASWGVAAGLGMSALMLANAWIFEIIRYLGAGYLLYLAVKSLRSALKGGGLTMQTVSVERLFVKGFLIHITNPKAILAWGAIYAIALPAGAGAAQVWQLFGFLIVTSMFVFFGYGILFSNPAIVRGYTAAKRWFDGIFAALFGAASLKILTARLEV
ncbi:LysE family translocator [Cognatishimia activa]|uniref:LysE family transporter n=1 Tax=Cognatishimia activa TaxID=1715691 RepID=A0A975I648_9RHOB|nr:LysE family translocator [Cognatishimia activa]QTN34602.1 LysE family transporter [Cognatishimia activa]